MKLKIFWTPEANDSFKKILDYLSQEFNENVKLNFIDKALSIIELTALFPKMFKKVDNEEEIRKGLITKNVSFFYRIKNNNLQVLYFWDNRRNPTLSKYNIH